MAQDERWLNAGSRVVISFGSISELISQKVASNFRAKGRLVRTPSPLRRLGLEGGRREGGTASPDTQGHYPGTALCYQWH